MNPPISNLQSPISYTDSPPLHPNLLLGAFHLLFWLFFHPAAYRNHIRRIDPTLRPDFAFIDLRREHWRQPALQRLLLQGYVILPSLAAFVAGVALWLLNAPAGLIAQSVLYGLSVGMAVGVAVGLASAAPIGLVFSLIVIVGGSVIVYLANGVTGSVATFMLASSVSGSVAFSLTERSAQPLTQQVGGVIVGMVMGFGAVVVSFGLSVAAAAGTAFLITGNLQMTQIPIGVARYVAFASAGGVSGGVAAALAFGLKIRQWRQGIVLGAIVGALFGLAADATSVGAPRVIAVGSMVGLLLSALFVLPYLLGGRVAGPWAGSLAGALGGSGGMAALLISMGHYAFSATMLAGLLGIVLGLTLTLWRPAVFYPLTFIWNLILLRLDEKRKSNSLLRWNSAFWDEHQRLPLIGLDEHVVLTAERNPVAGRAAMDYLFNSRQRWAAQAAQIELDARGLERCGDVQTIRNAYAALAAGELEGPASALLRSFSRISQDTHAALEQESAYNQRLALSAVEDRLDGLLRELTRSDERYAARFRPIAARWRETVGEHIRELAEAVEQRQEIDSPYIIGVPLTEQQEIFVGRTDISARIEQLLLDRRRPPLLLYGQRRMGKTSLLNNLGRLLPSTLTPLFVDLQGPASRASDPAGFLYNMARGMTESAARQRELTLPPLPREALAGDPFTAFDEWLDGVEKALGENTALLSLDEFEVLDSAFAEGRFSETAVLGMLRHLIQHRPRFKVLLAGSHTLDEVQRWASYLINVQVVKIGYLAEAETRLLIEQPVKDFALRYEPEASRRAAALTRGHPFLTQLLCAEIVALKNEQAPAVRRLATLADVEAAAPNALSSGSFFFADIERNQVSAAGLNVLRAIAAQGEGGLVSREALAAPAADKLDETLAALLRRDLIEAGEGGYRFQVELIRRWFEGRETTTN